MKEENKNKEREFDIIVYRLMFMQSEWHELIAVKIKREKTDLSNCK